MEQQGQEPLPPEVNRLRQRVQRWRQSKGDRFSRTPGEFWEAAVPLAVEFGACRVARTVGLDYGGLRKRVAEQAGQHNSGSRLTFVEVPATRIMRLEQVDPDVRPNPSPESTLVVDISRPDGARMRISLGPHIGLEATEIVAAFLGRSR